MSCNVRTHQPIATCCRFYPEQHRRRAWPSYEGGYIQFLGHARGSLCEVQTQIFIGHRLGYIPEEQKQIVMAMTDELGRILNGLITSLVGRKLKPLASRTLAPDP